MSSDPWSFTAIHYNRECKKMGKFLEIDNAEMKGVHFSKCMRITVEINLLQLFISKIEMERSQCRCNSSTKDYQNFATDVDVRAGPLARSQCRCNSSVVHRVAAAKFKEPVGAKMMEPDQIKENQFMQTGELILLEKEVSSHVQAPSTVNIHRI